jgi:ADP-ribose pyrophosphatase
MTVKWSGRYLQAIDDGGWEYMRRVGGMSAAVILAITDDGEIVLIEQHRPALGASAIELPAGLIGDEDGAGETPRQTAERELLEETGFTALAWRDLGEFATSPGMSAETFHLFLATGLSRENAGGGTAREKITVHLVQLAEVAAFADERRAAGCAIDCRLIAFLPWARLP